MKAPTLASTLVTLLAMAVLCLASCGGEATPPGQVSSPSGTPRATAPTKVAVPSNAGTSQIDACIAQARADGPGTWVVFPAGKFAYSGTLVVPDRINLTGQGVWDQGAADGGGGTWLQCPIKWGSYSTIAKLLLGFNTSQKTCTFTPCAMGDPACGTYTQAHGSTGCTFSQIRFKGGSDEGGSVVSLASNWGKGWSTATNPLKKRSLIDTTFIDCEFERPQAANSVRVNSTFAGGNPGDCMELWYDCRAGGAQISGNRWIRCHFGVKNGYHTGLDGYGVGTTILVQGSPDDPASSTINANSGYTTTGGSVVTNANWNPKFDWSQVDHSPTDNTFQDCLFEYATWYPMDLCDSARSYSMWQGIQDYLAAHLGGTCTDGNKAAGWGNPPGSQWVNIPDRIWLDSWNMTGCYQKGSYPNNHGVVGEVVRNSHMTNSYCGTGQVFNQAGSFGNTATGSFPGGHPTSPIFTVDWSGAATSYTPSPYDP